MWKPSAWSKLSARRLRNWERMAATFGSITAGQAVTSAEFRTFAKELVELSPEILVGYATVIIVDGSMLKVLRLQEKAPPLRLSEGRGFKGRVTFAEGSRVLPHQSNSGRADWFRPPERKAPPRRGKDHPGKENQDEARQHQQQIAAVLRLQHFRSAQGRG
jgi:hypothetical protein